MKEILEGFLLAGAAWITFGIVAGVALNRFFEKHL